VRIFFKFHGKNKKFQELDGDVTADFFYPAGKTGRMPVDCTRTQDQENGGTVSL
jgi:hypothetical protein